MIKLSIALHQAQNEDKIGGGILAGGHNISTHHQVSPPGNGINHAQKTEGGGSGDSGDIITLLEVNYKNSSTAINSNQNIFSKRYVAFDFEWSQGSSNSMLAAAFVDNQGNSKVLNLTDFPSSDNPERDLLLCINQELMMVF